MADNREAFEAMCRAKYPHLPLTTFDERANSYSDMRTDFAWMGWQLSNFQSRVAPWMQACFGPAISSDRLERGDRLLEEVLELLQSGEYPVERVAALTAYVWSRPVGEPAQEVGGVQVTLAAYCLAHGIDMHEAGETELARIWTKVEAIRAKQAAKPTGSALPQAWPLSDAAQEPAPPPASLKLVPVKPTPEMVDVGEKARWRSAIRDANNVREIYAAMLAAAPVSTAADSGEELLRKSLNLALKYLERFEPGDSRAVSNEFVAMAAVACDCANDDCVRIIDEALASTTAPPPSSEPKGCPTPGACSCSQPGGAVKVGGLIAAARRYMLAVKRLGEDSGYNRLSFFEAPISKMPNDDLGMEAVERWTELNDAGKDLTAACDLASSALSPSPSGWEAGAEADREACIAAAEEWARDRGMSRSIVEVLSALPLPIPPAGEG